jgi:hypothetical protein
MKNVFTIVLSAFIGAIAALLFQRPPKVVVVTQTPSDQQRQSRKIEEIAPTFKLLENKFAGGEELYEDHRRAWIKFVREAVKPNLTELEADQIAQAILEYEPPAYNYFDPLFPAEEKEENEE